MRKQSGASLRVAVDCVSIDQVLALLAFTETLGLTPKLGAGPGVSAPRPVAKEPRKKAKRKGKKRRSSHMTVRVSKPAQPLPPKANRAHELLLEEFGRKEFVKKDAIPILKAKLDGPYSAGIMTSLFERGALVPA